MQKKEHFRLLNIHDCGSLSITNTKGLCSINHSQTKITNARENNKQQKCYIHAGLNVREARGGGSGDKGKGARSDREPPAFSNYFKHCSSLNIQLHSKGVVQGRGQGGWRG